MVGYSWPNIENEKMSQISKTQFFFELYIDPGGPGGHPGGPRTDSEAEKHQKTLYSIVESKRPGRGNCIKN